MELPREIFDTALLFSDIREDGWANLPVGTTWQAEDGRVTIVKCSADFMAHPTGDVFCWECATSPVTAVDRLRWTAPHIWA
jgi:hypothetical protein